MSRLDDELRRVFGDPPVAPRAVMRVQVAHGQGLEAGREEGDRFVDAGADLVVIDSDVVSMPALAAVAALLDLDPVGVVGTGSAAGDPDTWRAQVVAVRDLLRSARQQVHQPEALATDPVLGRLVGVIAQLTERATPVLLGGGTAAAVAAMLAQRMQPFTERRWLAGSLPTHPAGRLALTAIGLTPLLDLELTHGSADVAVSVVRTGLELLGA